MGVASFCVQGSINISVERVAMDLPLWDVREDLGQKQGIQDIENLHLCEADAAAMGEVNEGRAELQEVGHK